MEILQAAKQEWHDKSGGLLTLLIQEIESTSKDTILIVHAKHVPTNRTATLFSVIYRPNAPYPLRIEPKGDELPNFLKKSYYQPGIADLASSVSAIKGLAGGQIINEWVSNTPSEFRSKLEGVFNLGTLKSDISNLMSGSTSIDETQHGQALEKPVGENPEDLDA